ncbi:MAG: M16 family metallopeptidase [Phycisphaerales bacterium]
MLFTSARPIAAPVARLAALVTLLLAAAAIAQSLPSDPRLVTGELDNGLTYIVRRHAVPPGRAAVWLHISTGSLNETEPQRGIAHFLEHMAFNGSEHFPPGTVLPFFQSLGLTFGVHQNAFTSFDQTVYQLALSDNTPQTLGKGMLFLSDVAFRLTLPAEEIEKERGIILEERRANLGGQQRVVEAIIKRWAPGSLIGERLPIGVEETIRGVTPQDFRDYYSRWYVPSNMMVMVVADLDEAAVVGAIREHFSVGERVPIPVDHDARVTAATEHRAIVASDRELPRVDVGILRVTPSREPVTTAQGLRHELVEMLGEWAFNRRLRTLVAEGKVSFQRGSASTEDSFRAIRVADISVSGNPAKWREMLGEVSAELRRAVLHGFSADEIDIERKELLSRTERAVEVEGTLQASVMLGAMNNAIALGEPITSAAQDLELVRSLLPGITPDEVAGAFRASFDPGPPGLLFVLQVPSSFEVPSEADFLTLGLKALEVTPEAAAGEARATALMETPPPAGRVAEMGLHADAQVWSAWLSNNVRVHHRFMDYRKDQVSVTITLAGGEIQETAADRGVAEAASVAWQRPATSRLSSTDIRDLMTGLKVTVSGRSGTDTMGVSVSGSPADLEEGMKLAHLLLSDPVVEPAAFEQWQGLQRQLLAFRTMQPEMTAVDAYTDAVYPPGDARFRPLSGEQIDAMTAGRSQAWLRDLIARAPIEVSVVGDISRDRAMDLVRTYLGSLTVRPRIGPTTLNALRALERPMGPITARRELETATDKAMVISGFFGAERDAVVDQQLLTLASRILTTRMITTLREQKQLVYSIGVTSSPALEHPGYGTVFALSTADPARAEELRAAIAEMYGAFAAGDLTEDEMATVRKQFATMLDERMREPGYWSGVLSTLTYRGTKLTDVLAAPGAYQSHAGAAVREAFARYFKPEAVFEVSVTPKAVTR